MRRTARVIGIAWMVACFALWLWVGLIWDYNPGEHLPGLFNWSVFALLKDSKFGLTAAPILLGGLGYALYRWGAKAPAPS